MNIPSSRRALLGVSLIIGLMAMALSCGGSAESPQAIAVMDSDAALAATPAAAMPAAPAPAATAAPAAAFAPVREVIKEVEVERMADMVAGPPGSPASQPQPQAARQLIVEARISLEVADIDPAVRQVEALAIQRGGWVESAEIFGEGGYRSASVNIRVQADRFDNTMDALRGLGRVTDEGVSSTDVTERLIDNQARLTAWYAQEERLVILLENAATVEDIIDIERRIAEVRSDIERVEATQRNLTGRVATSLIQVNLHLPPRFAADPPHGALTLAVGDPSATADAIVSRVETLNGYIGEKREYQQDRGTIVELTAFVRSTDLAGLMDYAATLGAASGRQLNSVGPSPAGDAPNAGLRLAIRSNVDLTAHLSLDASDAIDVAGQIRARAESLGGFVEQWNEFRDEDEVRVNLELVVKSADLREIMDFGASLGETEHWEYNAMGQNPADDAPNARLSVSVMSEENYTAIWIVVGVVGVIAVAAAIAAVVASLLRRRRSRHSAHAVAGLETDSL